MHVLEHACHISALINLTPALIRWLSKSAVVIRDVQLAAGLDPPPFIHPPFLVTAVSGIEYQKRIPSIQEVRDGKQGLGSVAATLKSYDMGLLIPDRLWLADAAIP